MAATTASPNSLVEHEVFPGGVTSLDAFAVGTPVVTLHTAQARASLPQLTTGMYRIMGMTGDGTAARDAPGPSGAKQRVALPPEERCCAVANVRQYVALAVRLASDAGGFGRRVRDRLVARRHLLFENSDVVDEWSRFLRHAVRQANSKKDDT